MASGDRSVQTFLIRGDTGCRTYLSESTVMETYEDGVLVRIRTGDVYICIDGQGNILPKERMVNIVAWTRSGDWLDCMDYKGINHTINPEEIVEFYPGTYPMVRRKG